MTECERYEVSVAKELADLIPDFLRRRREEIAALRQAFAESNVEQLRFVGHRMRSIGSSYGFHCITALGRQIEAATKAGTIAVIAALVEKYESYLSNITVTFV